MTSPRHRAAASTTLAGFDGPLGELPSNQPLVSYASIARAKKLGIQILCLDRAGGKKSEKTIHVCPCYHSPAPRKGTCQSRCHSLQHRWQARQTRGTCVHSHLQPSAPPFGSGMSRGPLRSMGTDLLRRHLKCGPVFRRSSVHKDAELGSHAKGPQDLLWMLTPLHLP